MAERRTHVPICAVAAAVASAVVLSACGGPSSYSANGVSFQYPHGWKVVLAPATSPGAAGSTSRVGVGLDQTNMVVLVTTGLAQANNAQDIETTEQSVAQALSSSATSHGATVQGPSADTLGGFEGFGLSIAGLQVAGGTVDSMVIVVVRDKIEYLLNCQSTQADADAIGAGCRQIIDSFTLG